MTSAAYLDKNSMLEKMTQAQWIFPPEIWDCLSDYDKSFIELEFTGLKTVSYYEERLKALGMQGLDKIVDAACGMGQWSVAMANLNGFAYGVDITPVRLLISREICKAMGKSNTDFKYASIDKMDQPDNSMDAVFCYGSFMFAPMDKTLAEFNRVLKPGGRLYLNANTTGWYLHLLFDRGIRQRNLRMIYTTAKMVLRTLIGKDSNIVVRKKWLEDLFNKNGFKIIASGTEGEICIDPSVKRPKSAYAPSYYGFPGMLEYLVEKK